MEEFEKWVEEAANEYAMSTVYEPEEHMDAVKAIADDFTEGAYAAYEKFISKND